MPRRSQAPRIGADSVAKGERFVVGCMLMVAFSYQTPWIWSLDAGFLGVLLLIGTVVNARENRVW